MKSLLLLVFLAISSVLCAQQEPYFLALEETELTAFEGLHSGVGVKWNQYWIFIGGRTNGLHGFRPPLAFPSKQAHGKIVIIDVALNRRWEQSMASWPDPLREPLSASNMQYVLEDDRLLICGGYGWQKSFDDFTTFPSLCSVNVPELVKRVQANESAQPLFSQLQDDAFALCGGNMAFMGDTCYLVFGHKFVGHYAQHNNGFFSQEYSNEVRRFTLSKQNELKVTLLPALRDTINFHRCDYNLSAQIDEKGRMYYTAFSGVFQYDANVPFYNPVELYRNGSVKLSNFEQKFSHYHSAVLPVYDAEHKVHHTYFFGGMAEYYLDSATGNTIRDTLVPFVKTISRVSKDANGYSESVLKARMPSFMGSNMWFFPAEGMGYFNGKVLNASYINGKTLVGYLVGGIISPYDNISLIDPSISSATKKVFKVYLSDLPLLGALQVSDAIGLDVFPNPDQGQFFIKLDPGSNKPFSLEILDVKGRILKTWQGKGITTLVWSPGELSKGVYRARLKVGETLTEKQLLWE